MLSVKAFVCNELQENTYVVYNESKNCVIIDAGNHLKEEDEYIIGFIDRNGLKPIMLLNTHSHTYRWLHILLRSRFTTKCGCMRRHSAST